MSWGNCSTLKVMNYRKDHIVEHITGYMFFLTTECGMCQVVRAGLKECLGVSWAGEGPRRRVQPGHLFQALCCNTQGGFACP